MEDILSEYQTSRNGLTNSEVKQRQAQYGKNELEEKKPTHPIILFLTQFVDILIALLVIAAIAAFAIGDVIDATVILIAVLLNAVFGFIQEYRSQKAVETLKNLMTNTAVVKRDAEISKIDASELTIGDIVILEEGDKVPADLILIESKNLSVDESQLTGESEAVNKTNKDELYMDSNITSGNAIGVVSKIGIDTSIGQIAELVQEESGETPLAKRVGKLGKILSLIAIIVCIFVFIIELFRGVPIVETFMTAVSLAVAAIPEGLPAVLTLTLALGMQEMAKSDAIVKRLLSVETLGSCTIICSDKTGTLTENKMTVKESYFTNKDKTLLIGSLCNNSTIKDGEIIGNQTDGAILRFCEDNSFVKKELENEYTRIDEIPLDSNRKMMTTTHTLNDGNNIVFSKGAPEVIINKCKHIDNNGSIEIITPEIKETLMKKISGMTDNALRVIAFAYKTEDTENPEENLIFTGLLGLFDSTKKNTKKAIEKCIEAGIEVKMITGDHAKTAEAIARDIGILTTGRVITGAELDALTDEEYFEIADDIQVYARVKPIQKMRIVEILKRKGNIVAMTGDGVNDAPALKKASIGIAMGDGTDVAKEAADMILQDDDFSTIVKAIKEGRKIYDNIKRFVKFQVSTNVGAIISIVAASVLSLPIPFNPVQLLWINIVMDGPPAQTLGMEGAEKDIMQRAPETGDILNKNILLKILLSGLVMAMGTIGVFAYYINSNMGIEKSMTVAFTLFVMYQLFNAYNGKANSHESSKYLLMGILLSLVLQILIIYLPQLQIIFRTTGIGLFDWIIIVIVAFTIILADRIMNRIIT